MSLFDRTLTTIEAVLGAHGFFLVRATAQVWFAPGPHRPARLNQLPPYNSRNHEEYAGEPPDIAALVQVVLLVLHGEILVVKQRERRARAFKPMPAGMVNTQQPGALTAKNATARPSRSPYKLSSSKSGRRR